MLFNILRNLLCVLVGEVRKNEQRQKIETSSSLV
jgi:hypothetical protein